MLKTITFWADIQDRVMSKEIPICVAPVFNRDIMSTYQSPLYGELKPLSDPWQSQRRSCRWTSSPLTAFCFRLQDLCHCSLFGRSLLL